MMFSIGSVLSGMRDKYRSSRHITLEWFEFNRVFADRTWQWSQSA